VDRLEALRQGASPVVPRGGEVGQRLPLRCVAADFLRDGAGIRRVMARGAQGSWHGIWNTTTK